MWEVVNANCIEAMKSMNENSVDLVITSPPYNVGKHYEKEWTNAFFDNLISSTFSHIQRLLRPGGYFVVNFGDCFNSNNRFYESDVPAVYPMTAKYFDWGRNVGFDLQATRIWRKQFARMTIPFVCNHHPRNVFDYEHIWTFRKRNGSNNEIVNDRKLSQRGVLGDGWKASAKIGDHCAAFPVDLPLWAIKVYSIEGNTVLDPFCGSGTTGYAAIITKRNFVGIELNTEYANYAKLRLEQISNEAFEL